MFGKTTLSQARRALQNKLDSGATCPCCDQRAKRYKRHLNEPKARALLWLVYAFHHVTDGDWVNVPKTAPGWLTRSREYSKLAYWGLAELREHEPGVSRTSGLWRPTALGIEFAEGIIVVEEIAHVYNQKVEYFSGPLVTIEGALGKRFNYLELLEGR